MKKFLLSLSLCMLCVLAVACGSENKPQITTQSPTTEATVPETAPAVTTLPTVVTEPEETTVPATLPAPTETTPQSPTASTVPYTTNLSGTEGIYQKPDQNSPFVQTVGISGIYTIVEEARDSNGKLWGKLKSGAGWVLLDSYAPPVKTFPYTRELMSYDPIYQMPDQNSPFVQCVGVAGIYTIMEEVRDANRNLWGKLKSGVGWVLLEDGGCVCTRCGGYFPYIGLYTSTLCEGCYFSGQ